MLAFVALIPLLWVEDHFYRRRAETRPVRLFVHAWVAFFIFNLLTTWWIMYATVPGMLVAVLLNPVFMALPWLVMHLSRRLLPGKQGQASLVLLWLSFEYLHALWDLNWSWLDLGNVFATMPFLVQWYEYTGHAGGTAWVLVVNLLLFALWKQFDRYKQTSKSIQEVHPVQANVSEQTGMTALFQMKRQMIIKAGLVIMVLIIPAVMSLVVWFTYEEVEAPVEVVVIQPSHDPYERVEQFADAQERVALMIALADSLITPETRFVVAPEAANPRGVWLHNAEDHFAIQMFRAHIDQHPGLIWVLGSMTYRLYPEGTPYPPSAEPFGRGDYVDVYNSVIMIEGDRPLAFHHKSKLVPGIERMPFYRYLKPLGALVARFGGIQTSMGTQDHREVFRTADGRGVVPAVCYESIYGQYLAEYIRNGAGMIFIVTNDGWWRHTPGHRQHHHYARLRAIESRRPIARSASTGISSFINQKGQVLKQTGWWEQTALSHEINQNNDPTFFVRQGNFLGKLSLFLSALLLAYMLSQRIIR